MRDGLDVRSRAFRACSQSRLDACSWRHSGEQRLTPNPTRSDSAGLWDLGDWLRRDHAFSTWPVVEFARKIWTAVPYAAIESREPLRGLSAAARVTELQP